MRLSYPLLVTLLALSADASAQKQKYEHQNQSTSVQYPSEKHFKNVRQLTFGGDNAEAYFGFDNNHISFQRTSPKDGIPCDRIYYGDVREKEWAKDSYRLVSTGK